MSASCAPHAPPLEPQHRGPEPVPSLETHHHRVNGRSNGGRYASRKEGTRMKSNGRRRANGKAPRYGSRSGKGDGYQHGQKSRIPELIPIAWFIHSFIHSGYLYSSPSRNLLRGALGPATVKEKSLMKLAERRHVVLR